MALLLWYFTFYVDIYIFLCRCVNKIVFLFGFCSHSNFFSATIFSLLPQHSHTIYHEKVNKEWFFFFPSSIASCLLNLGWIRFDFLWQEVNTLFSDIKSHVQVFHYAVCVCVHMTLFSIVRKKFRFFIAFSLLRLTATRFFSRSFPFFPFEHKTEQGMKSWYDYIPHGGKFNWSCICRKWSYYFSVDFSNFLIGFRTVYGYAGVCWCILCC